MTSPDVKPLNPMVDSIVLEVLDTVAMICPADVLTFAGLFGCFHVHGANRLSTSRCRSCGGQMRSAIHTGKQAAMSASIAERGFRSAAWLFLPLLLLNWAFCSRILAQQSSATPMRLTLDQAIDLALKQNHSVRLRSLSVEQMEGKKDEARSNYFPQIKASGSTLHITELEGIEIPAGAFGSYPSTGPIPSKSLVIDQGSATWDYGGV